MRACSRVPGHSFHTKVHSYLSRALPSHCLSYAAHRARLPQSSKYTMTSLRFTPQHSLLMVFHVWFPFSNKSHVKPNIQQYPMPLHSLIPLACVNDPQDLHSRLSKTTVHASSSTWTTGISAGKHRFKKAAEKDWLVVTNRVSLLPQSHTNICKTWEECWESSFFFGGGEGERGVTE